MKLKSYETGNTHHSFQKAGILVDSSLILILIHTVELVLEPLHFIHNAMSYVASRQDQINPNHTFFHLFPLCAAADG